jgi:predicted ATP-dependent protease
MPQSPEDLSSLIKRIAQQLANEIGRVLSDDALERISVVPEPYLSQRLIQVNQEQLGNQLRAIVEIAADSGRQVITVAEIEDSLQKVRCHYLWFC